METSFLSTDHRANWLTRSLLATILVETSILMMMKPGPMILEVVAHNCYSISVQHTSTNRVVQTNIPNVGLVRPHFLPFHPAVQTHFREATAACDQREMCQRIFREGTEDARIDLLRRLRLHFHLVFISRELCLTLSCSVESYSGIHILGQQISGTSYGSQSCWRSQPC